VGHAREDAPGQTTVSGLEPGKTYLFGYRAITRRGGEGDWSDPISFIVR
jgi:hypothetical protein